jgi:PAS domain S-box-containing protein
MAEEKLLRVLDYITEAIVVLDEAGRAECLNRAALDLFKRTGPGRTLPALSFQACMHPNDREGFSRAVKRLFHAREGGQEETAELRFRIRGQAGDDWTAVVARASCSELAPEAGKICTLFIREDKERRRTDPLQERYQSLTQQVLEKSRKLAEYEAEYQTLLETMNDGVLVLNVDHRVIFANENLAGMLGYTIEEMIGTSVFTLFDEQSHGLLARQLERRAAGISDSYEALVRCKDGRSITCLVRGAPRWNAEGAYAGIVANITDISVRKELEERLKASERQYRKLFEHMQDAVFQADPDGRITALNRAGSRMLGCERPEEVIGEPIEAFYLSQADWERLRKELFERGSVADHTSFVRGKDGRVLAISISAHLIMDKTGECLGIEGVARDVTERVKMEKQLQEYAADLEKKNEELESLVYSVTHDFKSPLMVIGGLANRLERMIGHDADPRIKEYVSWIRTSASKMEKMVNDLLGFYKADKTPAACEEDIPMTSLVDTVLRDAEPLAQQKGISLRKEGGFPAVRGYRHRLYQVLYNLVDNAIKYMDQTEGAFVEVGCAQREGEHCFYVRDNGPGIPPEHHHKVFQIFYTLEPERVSGTGIGLSIAKKIVELHGGRIWLESEPGKGTTFFFTLSGAGPAPGGGPQG